ncbi:MAG: hypothetical protein H0V30_09490 [Chitinophagaceae bacterium]|jgi:cytosine/uracil/thiamine/allantoin permease|nr:hypothetical protein [Chitinophagaceae bacterium]
MQKLLLFYVILIITTLSSCELVGDILEFGIWVGVIIVVAIIALIWWIVSRFRR